MDVIKEFLDEEKIEYYAVLDYAALRKTRPELTEREGMEPKTAIIMLVPYYVSTPENISRYAASLDYHIYIREMTSRLSEHLAAKFPEHTFVGYGDHSPIDERHAALIGGLGILGDNGLLINEKYGSYVFIADLLTDVPPEQLGAIQPVDIGTCVHCGACGRACPTGILSGKGADCLSAITQRKGELNEYEQDLMQKFNTVWGCDLCQSSCPYNRDPSVTPIVFFHRDRVECLTRPLLDGMSKAALRSRAFGWRGRTVLERNLEIMKK
ncbi:MAG: epoxyqueuosine reductase [Clostridia bacterium]|nr:epoxyqueuosine reductase [Clostridia bacterium]